VRLFYDWAILPIADLVAYLMLVPVWLAPFFATAATWVYAVQIIGGNNAGRQRVSTVLLATLLSAYVFAVTVTAAGRLPHVYFSVMRDDD
jgi:hypothetical protein